MRRRFEDAIRQVGGFARLPGGENVYFPVSVQPQSIAGDGHGATGTGFFRRFTLYTVYSDTTMAIKDGDRIEYQNVLYHIQSIDTVSLGGEEVYRQGIIIREEEGGY